MNESKFRIFLRMFIVVTCLFSLVWITKVIADDVYNFYFQKGGAPNTVVQGGAGQATSSATPVPRPAQSPEETPSSPVSNDSAEVKGSTSAAAALAQQDEARRTRKPFAITLGYAGIADKLGSERAYTLGTQYNFNAFLGARLQGRLLEHEPLGGEFKDRLGGMLALVLTPLRLDLFGHRLLEVSVSAGAEVARQRSLDPLAGVSALLSLNENFGVELQAHKSTKASFIGLNVAFLF